MAVRRVDIQDGEIVRLGVRKGREWVYAMERMDLLGDDEDETDDWIAKDGRG
jgi:hypothetical protein